MPAVGSIDVEVLLIGWLQQQLGDGVVVRDELDNELLNELPTVQVQRVGGSDDGFRLDRALVDVDVYAASRGQGTDLAATARGLLLTRLPGTSTGTAVVGAVRTLSAPASRPYENTALRRIGATYELNVHPVS